ncbi:hypothetical protein MJO29_009752 [Puccinia striiformis f. sp. tritici]|nr:hypothetical protein MJO29_009752 [Puccinia striiformis f. sp. tritici]
MPLMNGTCHTVEATQWSKSMKSHTLPYLAMQNNNETEAFLDAQYHRGNFSNLNPQLQLDCLRPHFSVCMRQTTRF